MDEDLEQMSRENLVAEVRKLRNGIRQHRDSTKHELCWHHPALWALLPERTDPVPVAGMAAIHGRLHQVSAIAGPAGAHRAPYRRALREATSFVARRR